MIQLIVACHGRFAEELVNSAAMVFGEAEGVHAVTFMPGEGPEDLIRKYEAIIAATGSADDVLFLVDLFGGSPYNAAIRVVAPTAKADVLSGVNLPMLLELLDSRDASYEGLLLVLQLPVSQKPVEDWETYIALAHEMSENCGGKLSDHNRRPLNERDLERLRKSVEAYELEYLNWLRRQS